MSPHSGSDPTPVRRHAFAVLGSTNAEALTLARSGECGPLWITAERQTAGRGRRGSEWISPPGNLYATLLLTEPSPVHCAPQLSFIAALAVYDALAACVPALRPDLSLKWPNDVLLGGAKVAGVLIEAENVPAFAVAIGIGVNCRTHPDSTPFPAIDLKACGAEIGPDDAFDAVTIAMAVRLGQWASADGFAAIRRDWKARAAGIGGDIQVRLSNRSFAGRFIDLDAQGRLLVQPPDGPLQTIAAGEVFGFGNEGL